jgi:alpha-methylacyl-CoA racemase
MTATNTISKHPRDDGKNPAATKARVAAIIATETADVWRFRFAGKDCCCSIVTSIADAFTDPHYVARGVFHHVLANPEGATMPAQLRGWQWVTGTVSG